MLSIQEFFVGTEIINFPPELHVLNKFLRTNIIALLEYVENPRQDNIKTHLNLDVSTPIVNIGVKPWHKKLPYLKDHLTLPDRIKQ